eukprot:6178652-Pleurochrysis_carterae.AAC.11
MQMGGFEEYDKTQASQLAHAFTIVRRILSHYNARYDTVLDQPSPSAGRAIESMMESLLLKGLFEVSLNEFNALYYAYTRLKCSIRQHTSGSVIHSSPKFMHCRTPP